MLCVEDLAVHEATELAAQETIDSTEDSEDRPQRHLHMDHPPGNHKNLVQTLVLHH